MSAIVSKNPYDLLGNDADEDPDRTPEPPTKAVDKSAARTGKRNGGGEAPAPRGDRGGRGRGGAHYGGNEAAFRDRQAGSTQNRSRDDGLRDDRHRKNMRDGDDERRGGRGRGRAGGYRGTPRDDRHSKTGVSDHEKQVAHGWGGNTGGEEWADEKAGEAIAKAEEKEGFGTNVPAPVNADGEAFAPDTNFVSDNAAGDGKAEGFGEAGEAELEEPIVKSYEDYLAEQANKKLHLGGDLEARRANEGSSKKFPEGKAFARANENENFFVGGQGKAKRERQKKEKSVLELDGQAMRPQEPRSERGRGGRGRGRGGDRGGDRGEFRDRGEHRERGEFRERGDFRGRGRGDRAPRGEYRGSRGGRGGQSGIQINDQSAFPTLGS